MFVIIRTIIYATIFISFVLIYVPARLLTWSGIVRPTVIELPQVAGMVVGIVGAVVALSCIVTFVSTGKGTPAPIDPPRKLVIQGPYRFVRNPMYIGAMASIAGAALFYQSLWLLGYTGVLFLLSHCFVVFYEELALRKTFGQEYETYCRQVNRWLPKL